MDNVKTRIRVTHTGHCYWAAPFIFKTSCHFNVRDFPFDEQQCKLKFGSWNFHKGQLDLLRKREVAPVAKERVENGEWNVTSIQIKRNEVVYACCPDEKYPDVTFFINLKRRSLFYTYNLIIPNFLIALLAFFSFYIPVECGERISFVITVLLSMTVFLLLVAESIPPTSEAVPVIGMYYTCSIIEVALALVATGISLKVYYSYLYGKGLSPRLQRFLFCRLAPLLWVDTEIVSEAKLAKNKSCFPFNCLKRLKSNVPRDGVISMYNVTENKANQPNGVATTAKNEVNLLAVDVKTSAETDIALLETQNSLSDQEIRQRVKKTPEPQNAVSSTLKGHKDIDFHATESRIAAAIVDRAFMVLFILVFFASTIIILLLPFIRKGWSQVKAQNELKRSRVAKLSSFVCLMNGKKVVTHQHLSREQASLNVITMQLFAWHKSRWRCKVRKKNCHRECLLDGMFDANLHKNNHCLAFGLAIALNSNKTRTVTVLSSSWSVTVCVV